ncbi:MAG: DUF7683 domain-containing protein [Panacagrimonas sp.]
MTNNVTRVLRWYELGSGDRCFGDTELKDMPLQMLQKLFGADAAVPMYDSWLVGPEHVQALQSHVATTIDLRAFAYFVEAEEECRAG